MRITLAQLLCAILFTGLSYAAHEGRAQEIMERKVTIHAERAALKNVLKDIEEQAEVKFAYSLKTIRAERTVDLHVSRQKLSDALNQLLTPLNIGFQLTAGRILLTVVPEPPKADQGAANQPEPKAPEQRITGQVVDEGGGPLPGVSVVVKGTQKGTITDAKGEYAIEVADQNAVLTFSFVGYLPQDVTVGAGTTIDIRLLADTKALQEVVVVGYGTQKKANLTGSVATVQIEDIQNRQTSNSLSALQGKVTGLRISQGSGMPGRESLSVQLRGASSWGTNSTPLILVDGVVGTLDALPVTDIESISVLKDAASASIYGARAANGVILVTTKKGKTGKPTLSYNMSIRSQSPTGVPNQIWNSKQYMELFNKAVARNAISASPFPQSVIDKYSDPGRDKNRYPDYNWSDAVWRTALMQDHNIGISGGSQNIKYNMSAGFVGQDGVLIGHDYKRFNGLANLTATVNKFLTVGTTITYLNGKSHSPYYENQNFVLMTMTQSPLVKPYLPDGSGRYTDKAIPTGVGGTQNNRNPFWIANETYRNYEDWQANIQGWADLNLIQKEKMGLKLSSKYATRFVEQFQRIYHYGADAYYYLPESDYQTGGSSDYIKGTPFGPEALGVFNNNYRTILNTFYSSLNYNLNLGHHDIFAMLGYSQEDQSYRWLGGNRNVFPVKNMYEIDGLGTLNQVVTGGLTEWAFRSWFGRATYAFKSKYLFEGNFRYDGTSRIFKDNRWGIFPSGSAAWRISEENFIKDNARWIDNLKLRGSYGLLGNANIGDYPWQETYTTTAYAFNEALQQGVYQQAFANRNIEWERTAISDIGLDFSFKNELIFGTFDWYSKYTKGILAGAVIPASSGLTPPTVNYGEYKNYGVELELGHRNKIGEVSYTINGQASINRNKVMKFQAPVYGNRVIEEGLPYNDYYLYEYIGIFKSQEELKAVVTPGNPQLGDIKFKDQNGDGVIDGNDRIRVKGAYPAFIYSFGGSVNWKNFDLSLFMQGVEGQKVRTYFFGEDPFSQGSSPHPKFLNAYDPVTNPNSDVPSIYGWGYAPMTGGTAQNSTYFLKNASYLRLKNLSIGYNVPAKLMSKVGINSLRVFVAGDNLLTFTKYPDLDPERAGDGWHAQYPQLKVYSVGLNVKF